MKSHKDFQLVSKSNILNDFETRNALSLR